MIAVGILLAALLQSPPDTLQVEKSAAPAAVLDPTPEFRAVHRDLGGLAATRFRIQVSTDPSFATITHWNGPAAGSVLTPNTPASPLPADPTDVFSREISYGNLSVTNAAAMQSAPRLSWGVTYHWRIKFWTNPPGPGQLEGPWSAPAQFTLGLPSGIATANGNGHPSALGWRFVGVPIFTTLNNAAPTTVSAAQLFDDTSTLMRWNEPTRLWIAMSGSDLLEGGRGYLFLASPGAPVDLAVGQAPSGQQRINLTYTTTADNTWRGQHLVVNPFPFPISWRAPGQASPGQCRRTRINTMYFKWDGTQYVTYNSAGAGSGTAGPLIEPFQAVNVIGTNTNPILRIDEPPDPTVNGPLSFRPRSRLLAAPGPDPNAWSLQIRADSAGTLDTETFAGTAFGSADGEDDQDGPEPGTQNSTYVLVMFDHFDWPTNPLSYTHDLQAPRFEIGDELVWTFTVKGNTGAPATLTWPNYGDLPTSDWEFWLEDPSDGSYYDLAGTTSFDTPPVTLAGVSYVLRAVRLTAFSPSFQIAAAAGGTPPPATVEEGEAGVGLLDLELAGVGEPALVSELRVAHTGTGSPDGVLVSIVREEEIIAGPVPFVGGEAVFSGLAEEVDYTLPQIWTITLDFPVGTAGEHGVSVEASQVQTSGAYSGKSITVAAATIAGPTILVVPAPADPAPSGGSSGGCGLLGFEVGLLLLAAGALRRSLR